MEDCIPLSYSPDHPEETNDTRTHWRNEPNKYALARSNISGRIINGTVSALEEAEETLYSRVVVTICVAGLIGNILNLAVLTHRRLRSGMSEIESTVYLGLAALAVSDMMFCVCTIPHGWIELERFYFTHVSFSLLYKVYSRAFINVFIMGSAWLTVTMAMSRYIAICYPLHARSLISRRRAYLAGGAIVVLVVLCNLPRFFEESIDTMACRGNWSVYYRDRGVFHGRESLFLAYTCAYFLVETVVPFSALVFCNARLVSALRRSLLAERDLGMQQNVRCMDHSGICRVTLTLILIVGMYMLLVVPVEIHNFVRHIAMPTPGAKLSSFNLVMAVLNVMQASNFAFHFVLYCIVNVHFRRTVKHMFKCSVMPGKVVASFRDNYAINAQFANIDQDRCTCSQADVANMHHRIHNDMEMKTNHHRL